MALKLQLITDSVLVHLVYHERVREVERACFSPLVFTATGGMGPTATTVFRKLALMLTEKHSINYSKCLF